MTLRPFTEAGTGTPAASSSVGMMLMLPTTSSSFIALLKPGPCTISGMRIELLCGLRLYSSLRVMKWQPWSLVKTNDRVVRELLLFEHLHQMADRLVDRLAAAVVVRQFRLPVAGQRLEVVRHKGIRKSLGRALRPDEALHVVLKVRLELRDVEQERLVVLLLAGIVRRGR